MLRYCRILLNKAVTLSFLLLHGQQRTTRKYGAVRIESTQTAPLLVECVNKIFAQIRIHHWLKAQNLSSGLLRLKLAVNVLLTMTVS